MRLLSPELGLASTEGIELTPARVIAAPDFSPSVPGGRALRAGRPALFCSGIARRLRC